MIKTKKLVNQNLNITLIVLMMCLGAFLVIPKTNYFTGSTTLVFEEAVVEVKAAPVSIARSTAQTNVAPKAVPIPMPIVPPRVLFRLTPIYPQAARLKGIEGTVVVKALVGADGGLIRANIKTSSGSSILDSSAVSSLSKWKFSPAKRGVSSIKSWLEIPFRFALN